MLLLLLLYNSFLWNFLKMLFASLSKTEKKEKKTKLFFSTIIHIFWHNKMPIKTNRNMTSLLCIEEAGKTEGNHAFIFFMHLNAWNWNIILFGSKKKIFFNSFHLQFFLLFFSFLSSVVCLSDFWRQKKNLFFFFKSSDWLNSLMEVFYLWGGRQRERERKCVRRQFK